VLYQPDRELPAVKPPGPVAAESAPVKPEAPGPPPEPSPGVPLNETPARDPDRPNVAALEPSAPATAPSTSEIPTAAPARVRPVSRTRSVPGPRSAFTVVDDGESLDDVALRVYGTAEKAPWLWQANRDLIARKESPLIAGTLLRTP